MLASRRRRFLVAGCIGAIVFGSVFFASLPAEAAGRTLVIEMKTVQFRPNELEVEPGDIVTVRVFNNDTIGHTFDIAEFNVHIGDRTNPLQPGQNDSRTFTADRAGTFWFFCDIPGHASRAGSGYTGMAGRLIVGSPPPPPDLTIPIVVVISVAVAAGLAGLVVWRRRKPAKP